MAMQPHVQALVAGWTAAFNAGRTSDLTGFYADDARLVPPGRPVLTEAKAFAGFFSDIRAQGFRDYAVEIVDALPTNGVVVASGRWALSGPGPDGAEHRYEGNCLIVLDSGAARILAHMWN